MHFFKSISDWSKKKKALVIPEYLLAYNSLCSLHMLLTLLQSEWPKLYGVLAVLSAIGYRVLAILTAIGLIATPFLMVCSFISILTGERKV